MENLRTRTLISGVHFRSREMPLLDDMERVLFLAVLDNEQRYDVILSFPPPSSRTERQAGVNGLIQPTAYLNACDGGTRQRMESFLQFVGH